jgi:hypothetical protein
MYALLNRRGAWGAFLNLAFGGCAFIMANRPDLVSEFTLRSVAKEWDTATDRAGQLIAFSFRLDLRGKYFLNFSTFAVNAARARAALKPRLHQRTIYARTNGWMLDTSIDSCRPLST